VAWIAGRTDVYATLFALLALWLDRRARRSGRRWCGPLPLAALALALLSKEIAAGTVLLVALAEWLDAGRTRASLAAAARWVAPHAALTAAVLLAHAALVRTPEAGGWLGELARTRGGWAAARLVPAYLAFLWPGFPHSPAVTLELPEAQEAAGALGLALSLALLAAVAVAVARRHPLALPGALALVGLAPLVAAGLLEGYVLYAERHFYLASAGAAWALAAAVGLAPGRARAPAALLLAAGIAWSAAVTLEVGRAWADDATLFERMSRDHPRNYMARIQWARLLADAGREAEALAQIEAAERLDPRRPDAAGVRAVVLARRGDWAGSLRAADRSIAAGSAEREPRLQRVAALLGLGRWDEARADLERLRSGAAPVAAQEALWGQYLVAAGRADEARAALAAAGARFPHDPDLAYTRGIAEAASDRPREAAAAFERAVELKPGHYDAWLQLAIARALTEDRAGARAALARAARLPGAADGRAAALERMLAGAR
jgi:tetratricopeptide (TPR) repeat protein